MLLICPLIFFKIDSFKKFFHDYHQCQNSLDPDQAQHFVGPDLGSNCLERLSADNQSTCLGPLLSSIQKVKYVSICSKTDITLLESQKFTLRAFEPNFSDRKSMCKQNSPRS